MPDDGVHVDLSGLEQLQRDHDAHMHRFIASVASKVAEAETLIVDTKLNLPGDSVRDGGTPGPSPGGPREPVLHRESAGGSNVSPEVHAKARRAQGKEVEPPVGGGALAASVTVTYPPKHTPGSPIDATFDLSAGSNLVYARSHEYGYDPHGIPRRPYVGPAFEILDKEVRGLVDELENGP